MTHPAPLRAALGAQLLATAAFGGCIPSTRRVAVAGSPDSAPLRVMTFNIRYDNPGDGVNAWPNRKDWVASLIRYCGADVIGM